MHVHHGEHLNTLLAPNNSLISSFVVASVGLYCTATERRVQCTTATSSSSASATERGHHEELYAQHYSPFTATRVVENRCSPAWNELLALSLPFEKHPQLALRLELVQRGPSQQEDFLLATAIVPLLQVAEYVSCQVRLALQFPVPLTANGDGEVAPRIFVSLRETTRDCFKRAQSGGVNRLELLVQRFISVEAPDTSSNNSYESLALAVAISSLSHGPMSDLTQLFTIISHQSGVPPQDDSLICGLTPSSVVRNRSHTPNDGAVGSGTSFQWHFPLTFELPEHQSGGNSSVDSRVVEIALYDTSNALRQVRIGTATLPLSQLLQSAEAGNLVDLANAKTGQSFTLSPPLAIYSGAHEDGTTTDANGAILLGHLHASIRCWSPAAWETFLRETPSRRVVSSNRSIRKTHALLELQWMGALLRGLNRYPVSSFCDEGGLSSVLVGFLAASSQSAGQVAVTGTGTNVTISGLSTEAGALLSAQVAQLQAETVAQRQQIERVRIVTLL